MFTIPIINAIFDFFLGTPIDIRESDNEPDKWVHDDGTVEADAALKPPSGATAQDRLDKKCARFVRNVGSDGAVEVFEVLVKCSKVLLKYWSMTEYPNSDY